MSAVDHYVESLESTVRRLRKTVDAVKGLHDGEPICVACGEITPCKTRRLIGD